MFANNEIGTIEPIEEIAKIAVEMKDIDHNPYKITKEMVEESIRKLEAI